MVLNAASNLARGVSAADSVRQQEQTLGTASAMAELSGVHAG